MNSDELRDLTESYYNGVYSEENIDEELTGSRYYKGSRLETAARRSGNIKKAEILSNLLKPSEDQTSFGRGSQSRYRMGINPASYYERPPQPEEHKRARGRKKPLAKSPRLLPESHDLYDVVLDHLLSEGYADDARSAEVIMTHMSDEWLANILGESESDNRRDQELKDMGVSKGWRDGVKRTV
jgi:hypothetical protein